PLGRTWRLDRAISCRSLVSLEVALVPDPVADPEDVRGDPPGIQLDEVARAPPDEPGVGEQVVDLVRPVVVRHAEVVEPQLCPAACFACGSRFTMTRMAFDRSAVALLYAIRLSLSIPWNRKPRFVCSAGLSRRMALIRATN